MKKQLTNIYENKVLMELEDNYIGFNNISLQEILDHLYDSFGEVTPTELKEAENSLSKPFKPH